MAALMGFVAGAVAQRTGMLGAARRWMLSPRGSGPVTVPAPSAGAFILVALGQSNAGNHGDPPARAGAGTFAATDAGFFACDDPLPGASGSRGSVWTRWAPLRHREAGREVVVASMGQGSSSVRDWLPGTALHDKLLATAAFLRANHCSPSAFVWHQGETEAWFPAADGLAYARELSAVVGGLRAAGESAPFHVCLATRDGNGRVNEAIRRAQGSVWNADRAIFAGVDTDSLGDEFRHDRVHFNQRGMEVFAELLEQALRSPSARQAPAWNHL